jgi:hypothetical protein
MLKEDHLGVICHITYLHYPSFELFGTQLGVEIPHHPHRAVT